MAAAADTGGIGTEPPGSDGIVLVARAAADGRRTAAALATDAAFAGTAAPAGAGGTTLFVSAATDGIRTVGALAGAELAPVEGIEAEDVVDEGVAGTAAVTAVGTAGAAFGTAAGTGATASAKLFAAGGTKPSVGGGGLGGTAGGAAGGTAGAVAGAADGAADGAAGGAAGGAGGGAAGGAAGGATGCAGGCGGTPDGARAAGVEDAGAWEPECPMFKDDRATCDTIPTKLLQGASMIPLNSPCTTSRSASGRMKPNSSISVLDKRCSSKRLSRRPHVSTNRIWTGLNKMDAVFWVAVLLSPCPETSPEAAI